MRVAFVLWGERPYMPGVKVTLDLADAVARQGHEVRAFLVQAGPGSRAAARERLGSSSVIECGSLEELPARAKEARPDVIFSKDHIDSVRALLKAREASGAAAVAFTSGFYGLETLRPPSSEEVARGKARPGVRKYVPFHQVVRRYRGLLAQLDGVLAISYYSEMLLELLYGIRPIGVVYPIVDPKEYTPPAPSTERRGILVFVGPSMNRPPSEYLPTLAHLPSGAGPIHLFGSGDAARELHAALGDRRAVRHEDLSTSALVALYQTVRTTYITSEWEGYGYVGVESLMCGTPVVLEVAQPWMEMTGESEAIRVTRGRHALLEALTHSAPTPSPTIDAHRARLAAHVAPEPAAKRFLRAVEGLPPRSPART